MVHRIRIITSSSLLSRALGGSLHLSAVGRAAWRARPWSYAIAKTDMNLSYTLILPSGFTFDHVQSWTAPNKRGIAYIAQILRQFKKQSKREIWLCAISMTTYIVVQGAQ